MDAERVARNDSTFRHANEQIERAAEPLGIEPVPFLCECAEERCTEIVRLTLAQYEAVRAEPRWFVNAPGHEQSGGPPATAAADCGGNPAGGKGGGAGERAGQ